MVLLNNLYNDYCKRKTSNEKYKFNVLVNNKSKYKSKILSCNLDINSYSKNNFNMSIRLYDSKKILEIYNLLIEKYPKEIVMKIIEKIDIHDKIKSINEELKYYVSSNIHYINDKKTYKISINANTKTSCLQTSLCNYEKKQLLDEISLLILFNFVDKLQIEEKDLETLINIKNPINSKYLIY